jgi:hypothetical protein
MALDRFEPATPAKFRPQTFALDRSATGIRTPDRQIRNESLHRLSYPGPYAP